MNKKKLLIGITGGIGAGKSYVSDYIESKGYPVLRADDIAKSLLTSDPVVKKKIISKFGEEAYINNKPNTIYLANTVFNNSNKLEEINSIVHPPTLTKIEQEAVKLFKKFSLVFVESALIYEANFSDMFSYVVLIYTNKEERIKRVTSKNKMDVKQVKQRMKFQIPDEQKKKKADFVIENNSTLEELRLKVDMLLNIIKSLQ
ncbi:dephospho-CoA kinase [Melioribacteraceae bacterium 4301-Me]|uniref:dephospho-CoA kinase n=1 Tax=Pyranulibacter aquaticus TaxID=3163344 RepID=UPI00359605A8